MPIIGRMAATLALIALPFMSIAAETPLRMVTIDVAPWASINSAGDRAVGVFPDLVAEIARRTGLPITISLQPFARIPHELQAGREDCTILVWTEAWQDFLRRGEVVSSHVVGVVARQGVRLDAFEDLHGLDVSVLRGLSLGERFDQDPAIRRQSDADYMIGLRQMAHGRVDAVAGALSTIRHLARQNGLSGPLGQSIVLGEIALPLQCNRRSPWLSSMDAMDAAIRAMRQDGTIRRILRAYDYE